MIINRTVPQNTIMSQLETEIKSILPLINISSTNDVYHFEFSDEVLEADLDNIIANHIPDDSIFYNNFSKLNINLLYDTNYNTTEVNSLAFVTCYTYNADIQTKGKYRFQINYKYAYTHSVRNITVMLLLNNNTIIDLIETTGLHNNLFVPNQVIKMIDLNKGINKINLKISCNNLEDTASIKDIVLELYRIN